MFGFPVTAKNSQEDGVPLRKILKKMGCYCITYSRRWDAAT